MQILLRVEDPDRRILVLPFEAGTVADAVRQAALRGLHVVAVEAGSGAAKSLRPGKRKPFPLLLFSQQLLALLEAGLNLTEALDALHAKERHPEAKDVLGQMLASLRRGQSFSDVLAGLGTRFPDLYIATVRAAERTGDLPNALSRYIGYQIQVDGIRKKLVSAAIYPAMLLLVGSAVLLFLLGYVVPKFSLVYQSSGRDLPWMSSMLLSFGRWVHEHWSIALLSVVMMVATLAYGLFQPAVRERILETALRVPAAARKLEEFRLARFYRALGLLLSSGVPLVRALGMTEGLLLPSQKRRLAAARAGIEQGQALSTVLSREGLASPVAESLVRVGERSGRLADMLEHTAHFHDDDFARWIDWASRLLEPVLMAAIGLVIGVVVVLMYIPIFELAGGLQ